MLAFFQDKAPCSNFIGMDIWVTFYDKFGQFIQIKVILVKGNDLRQVFTQRRYESSEKCLVSLDSVGVLSAYSNYPGVQQSFEIRGAEENLFVIFDETCTKSKEVKGYLWIILKLLEIRQNIVDSMRGNMIECFLEDRLIVSIGYVGLHTEFYSIDEARQVILFVSLYHHLQEAN